MIISFISIAFNIHFLSIATQLLIDRMLSTTFRLVNRNVISGVRQLSASSYTPQFNFAPASTRDSLVFGAERPGADSKFDVPDSITPTVVNEWLDFMKKHDIKHIISLLNDGELQFFQSPGYLAAAKAKGFGLSSVNVFEHTSFKQLNEALDHISATETKCVVHCSGGEGRTGIVLALWLQKKYGLSAADACKEVVDNAKTCAVSRRPKLAKLEQLATTGTLGDVAKGSTAGGRI